MWIKTCIFYVVSSKTMDMLHLQCNKSPHRDFLRMEEYNVVGICRHFLPVVQLERIWTDIAFWRICSCFESDPTRTHHALMNSFRIELTIFEDFHAKRGPLYIFTLGSTPTPYVNHTHCGQEFTCRKYLKSSTGKPAIDGVK